MNVELLQQNLVDHSYHREQNPKVLKGPLRDSTLKSSGLKVRKKSSNFLQPFIFQLWTPAWIFHDNPSVWTWLDLNDSLELNWEITELMCLLVFFLFLIMHFRRRWTKRWTPDTVYHKFESPHRTSLFCFSFIAVFIKSKWSLCAFELSERALHFALQTLFISIIHHVWVCWKG